jgi:2-polyprenyl-3-methyl-5-hydroxy-6-metoxy-1,4-benzoquinol methylase
MRSLDLGCGDGVNALELELCGYEHTGIDISALALTGLRNRFKRAGHNLRGAYIQAAVEDMPAFVFDQEYDVIISCGLFHCLSRTHRVDLHRHMTSCCRPGGWILFSTISDAIEIPANHGTAQFELPNDQEVDQLFAGCDVISKQRRIIEDSHLPLVQNHCHEITWVAARARTL